MNSQIHSLTLPGAMLRRGFWLYVWVVASPVGELLYVGRTGDNSSPHASAPYTRMGQHLGSAKNQNALKRHLLSRGVSPEECQSFDLIAFGPLFDEVEKLDGLSRDDLMKLHIPIRDAVGALEKVLAEELKAAGYDVLNSVSWKHPHDVQGWEAVRQAYVSKFPKLGLGN